MNITVPELKKIILKQLNSQSEIDSVDDFDLIHNKETISVLGKITAQGYDVEFSGELQNSDKGVELADSEIKAGFFVKAFIRPYLKRLPALIKTFLEKHYKIKIDSISITPKGLLIEPK